MYSPVLKSIALVALYLLLLIVPIQKIFLNLKLSYFVDCLNICFQSLDIRKIPVRYLCLGRLNVQFLNDYYQAIQIILLKKINIYRLYPKQLLAEENNKNPVLILEIPYFEYL